jgi:hypothetical protein
MAVRKEPSGSVKGMGEGGGVHEVANGGEDGLT